MKQLLKKLLLLLNLIALALPLSAASGQYTTVAAGTEFEPISGTTGFFIKDKNGHTNSNLKFINNDSFVQDIEVCDNNKIYQNGGKLYFLGDKESFGGDSQTKDAYKGASNLTNLNVHEYVVSTPKKVNKVGGLSTLKNKPYSDKWMFITKTIAPSNGSSGPGSSILFYTLNNPKTDSNFKVEIGFVNIADVNSSQGGMEVNLKYYIYGVEGPTYKHLQWGEWSLNAGQSQSLTTKKSNEFNSKKYDKIIVAILNRGSQCNHIFGLDYIHVYSQYDIMDKTATPTAMPYNECVVTPGEEIHLSSRVTISEGSTGELKFYKDVALTQAAPTSFNTGTALNTTYYYTYQEEGKTISNKGELSINVNALPVISALTSKDNHNNVTNTITCAEPTLTITPTVSTTNVNYTWDGPEGYSKTSKIISVTKPGVYTLTVTDKTSGCFSSKPIEITAETTKPTIEETFIKNSSGEATSVINCINETLTLSATVESVNDVDYVWSTRETSSTINVASEATYTLKVVDKKTGCESEAKEFVVTENKTKPEIEKLISTNSNGDESTIITCTDVTLTITPTVSTENVEYLWNNNKTTQTITETADGTYTLVVTNTENGCKSEPKSITLTKDESVPTVTITSYNSLDSAAKETNLLTCSDTDIYIVPTVTPSNVTFVWNGDETKNENNLKVSAPGVYTLKVISNINGCTLDGIQYDVKLDTIKPKVNLRTEYNPDGTEGSTEFTCERRNITLVADTNASEVSVDSYKWSNEGSTSDTQMVGAPGDYSVTVVAKNGCEAFSSIYLTENVVHPDITVTSLDSKGESRTVLTCDEPEVTLHTALNNESELGTDGPVRYFWILQGLNKSDEVQTTKVQSPDSCVAQVIGPNGCVTTAGIRLTLDNYTPIVTITQSADTITCDVISSTISATADIDSNYEWTFGDKTYTDVTEITVETKGTGSLKVTSKETGCEASPVNFTVEQSIEKPSVPVIDNTKLALCPETGNYDISSFIKDKKNNITYTFYDESGEALLTTTVDTKTPNTQYSYTVVATAKNGCDSETAEFDVTVDGFVDFDLMLSRTDALVVGDDIVATVVPTGVEAETYTWLLNGEKVAGDILEYNTKLYIDSKFEVIATSRCDSKTREASVEVLWPTAFTPHNKNGKNDTFAEGMKLMIFNRFYTKIYEGDNGWDGTINGSLNDKTDIAVPGVYYYSVFLPNGEVKKGTIEIVKID